MPQQLDGRYEILKPLGSGGFGKTYLARDLRIPGTPYCVVKQLHCSSSKPADKQLAQELFRREGESLAQLGHHDQIPRLLAYFSEDDEFYLVEDFIEGRSLEDDIQAGQPWSEAAVIDLLSDVLEVLAFVHAQGVIHRDIKPANLIRRHHDGKIVLIDFGAIKQIGQSPLGASHRTGTQIGTAGYMSPEQAQGKPRPNSDLYSIGVVAISALTGYPVMALPDDPQTGEIQWQHLTTVTSGLAQILAQMVRYYFQNRYQHVEEVQQALAHLSQGRTRVQNGPSPPPSRPHQPISHAATQVAAPNVPAQPVFTSQSPARGTPWLLGFGLAVLIPALGGAAAFIFNTRASFSPSADPTGPESDQPCTAVVVGNIRSERTAYHGAGNILQTGQGQSFEIGTQETRGGWIEIKLPSGQMAWSHLDVVTNESALKSCLQTKNITLKRIADIPPPPRPKPVPPPLSPPVTNPVEANETPSAPTEDDPPTQSVDRDDLPSSDDLPDTDNPIVEDNSTSAGESTELIDSVDEETEGQPQADPSPAQPIPSPKPNSSKPATPPPTSPSSTPNTTAP